MLTCAREQRQEVTPFIIRAPTVVWQSLESAQMNSLPLLIVAGEPSGDAHAAALVHALRAVTPETNFEFFGSTGSQMRDAGVASVVNADELAIVGLWEIGRAL